MERSEKCTTRTEDGGKMICLTESGNCGQSGKTDDPVVASPYDPTPIDENEVS